MYVSKIITAADNQFETPFDGQTKADWLYLLDLNIWEIYGGYIDGETPSPYQYASAASTELLLGDMWADFYTEYLLSRYGLALGDEKLYALHRARFNEELDRLRERLSGKGLGSRQ